MVRRRRAEVPHPQLAHVECDEIPLIGQFLRGISSRSTGRHASVVSRWLAAPVALAVAAVASCSAGSDSSSPRSSATPADAVRTVSLHDREIARFRLTGQPDWLAADTRFLYVKEDGGDVVAIDPRTDHIAWRVTAASDLCQGLGVGFGSVWTCRPSTAGDSDDLVRIDPRSHRIVDTYAIGKSQRQGHLVTGFGRVWVIRSTPAGSSLVGIDPTTGRADQPIALGMLAAELAIDSSTVWAVGPTTGDVVGVDPTSRKVAHRIGGLARLGGPSLITVGAGLLWVSGEAATVGIDRASGQVRVEVRQGAKGYGGFLATDTDLWLHSGDPFLTRVDPATGRMVERVVAPDLPNPGDVLSAFGSLWASSNNQATVVRLRPS